jgi:hypothetical protein
MNRTILSRLHRLDVRAGLDGLVEHMTDEELFSAFMNLIERVGGADAFAETLREEGEERLADSVLLCATCTTAAEFMAVEHWRPKGTRPTVQPYHVG